MAGRSLDSSARQAFDARRSFASTAASISPPHTVMRSNTAIFFKEGGLALQAPEIVCNGDRLQRENNHRPTS